jgi:Protein of unknown function (DUF998)
MMRDKRLLFGPLGAGLLLIGIIGLAFLVPGYSQIRQTVSEIGEMDSPARVPFAVMLCLVSVCLIVFASGVRAESRRAGHNALCAYLIICMAVSGAGVGLFAFPHPLHNVFGLSETIGYQAPLAFALAWRADPSARRLVAVSWLFFALVWISIALNMTSMVRQGSLWMHIKPYYGLVQRSLFAAWFCWCAGLGVLLWQRRSRPLATRR